jgi:hypothetical protein
MEKFGHKRTVNFYMKLKAPLKKIAALLNELTGMEAIV